jgi:CIC family chloride channel protein
MASVAVGIVGGPMTMTFLVLETTNDLAITVAVLAASIMSAVIVREIFGYSFSTWRLHLRGETIRGAHDVGRMRDLTVGRMMRSDVRTVASGKSVEKFRKEFPLGSTQRVIAVDGDGRYVGVVVVADAYAPDVTAEEAERLTIGDIVRHRDVMLVPSMNVEQAAKLFETAKGEELAVVDNSRSRRIVGLLTEQYLLRRYTSELDKARRDMAGED